MDWLTAASADILGQGKNGYYAFTNTFALENLTDLNLYKTVTVSLDGWIAADDHIEAIYLNGIQIGSFATTRTTEDWHETISLDSIFGDFTFSALGLNATDNQLSFIIHNSGHLGAGDIPGGFGFSSKYPDGSNAYGFGGDGEISLTIAGSGIVPPTTPEPATMLIFGLGTLAAGACTAVRRKRK